MKKLTVIITILISTIMTSSAIHSTESANEPYIRKGFAIIKSTKDYSEALRFAQRSSSLLNLKLNLRGLKPHKKTGLTFNRKICNDEGGSEYPCYISRGRYDNGKYISIEYSDAYQGFRKGYYIVIIASYQAGSKLLEESLNHARKHYRDAYIKISKVYVGCIH